LTEFLPIEPYDLIYSFGVIHHSPRPEAILAQLRNYVHPETEIKIMVYYRYSWKALWIVLTYGKGKFWRMRELVAKHSEAQTGCPVTYTYSRKEAERLLESGGFRTTSAWVDHIFPYRIRDYIQYRYVRNWYFRWMPPGLFRWFEQQFGWHLCVSGIPVSAQLQRNS
jgi:hypothetical protein